MRFGRLLAASAASVLAISSSWAGDARPVKSLTSSQVALARVAILADGKKHDDAMAKIREVGPLTGEAVEKFLKRFVLPLPAHKAGLDKRTIATAVGEGAYVLSVPGGYTPARSWPLIISLHGAGGNGDGEYSWMWTSEGKRWGGFIACPSGQPPGAQWFPEQEGFVLGLLRDVVENFNIDRNRVYVHGFSNGGNGAWHYGQSFPWLFGAACPRGGGNPDPGRLENLLHVGVYVVHGENDPVIRSDGDRSCAKKLEELGYDAVYVEIPGGGHEPFHQETPKVVEYFRKHERDPWPKTITYQNRDGKPARVYWVDVTKPTGAFRVEAKVEEGNRIALAIRGAGEVVVHLSDALVNLDDPVTVTLNGTEAHGGPVTRSFEALVLDLRSHRDPPAAGCAALTLAVP